MEIKGRGIMGDSWCEPDILSKRIIDYDKLFEIKDFLLLMDVIEHLENKILAIEGIIFHFELTIVYAREDLERLLRKN